MKSVSKSVSLPRAREILLAKLPVRLSNRLEDKHELDTLTIDTIIHEARSSAKFRISRQRGMESLKQVSLRAAETDVWQQEAAEGSTEQEQEERSEVEDVNQVQGAVDGRQTQRQGGGPRGRLSSQFYRGRGRRGGRFGSPVVCYYCGKPGHRRAECWTWLNDQRRAAEGEKPQEQERMPTGPGEQLRPSNLPKKKLDQIIEVALGSPGDQLQLKCGLASKVGEVIRKKCLIDTGAGLNVIPLQLACRQGWIVDESVKKRVRAFNNSVETSLGTVTLEVQLGSSPALHLVDFDVLGSAQQVILGLPALAKMEALVDCSKGTVTIKLPDGTERCIHCVTSKDCLRQPTQAQEAEDHL